MILDHGEREAAVDQAEGENGKEGLEKDSHQNQTGLCQRDPSPSMLKLQKLKPKLEVGVCNPLCGYRSMRPTQAQLSSCSLFGMLSLYVLGT